jgi:hypothetical protein
VIGPVVPGTTEKPIRYIGEALLSKPSLASNITAAPVLIA